MKPRESTSATLERSGWGPGGRRFKSCLPDQRARAPACAGALVVSTAIWRKLAERVVGQAALEVVGAPRHAGVRELVDGHDRGQRRRDLVVLELVLQPLAHRAEPPDP